VSTASERLPFELPENLAGFDAAFMTRLLHYRGAIEPTNRVEHMEEEPVGMTAGYFSALKKVTCTYREPTGAPRRFVIKTWPQLEIMPTAAIQRYFRKDIAGYSAFGPDEFYPRPRAWLAACDDTRNRWALVMEDAEAAATHKKHESELTLAEARSLIPRLVDVAVRWEGCDTGPEATRLDALDVDLWASQVNLDTYASVMAGGAPLLDRMLSTPSWMTPTWNDVVGRDTCVEFTRHYHAFFANAHPRNGATCTLAHGDFRGDNLFLGPVRPNAPDGWTVIDFQMMFRGPVPSDLAYLLNSGSVLPEVYTGDGLRLMLREFHDAFAARTRRYPSYTYDQFEREYVIMSTVLFVYYIGMGAAYWQAGAFRNELPARIELGNAGATEADLTPEERRQRMWWRKVHTNLRETFRRFDLYGHLQALPLDEPSPAFIALPPHLMS
jgi:hypothetical protein